VQSRKYLVRESVKLGTDVIRQVAEVRMSDVSRKGYMLANLQSTIRTPATAEPVHETAHAQTGALPIGTRKAATTHTVHLVHSEERASAIIVTFTGIHCERCRQRTRGRKQAAATRAFQHTEDDVPGRGREHMLLDGERVRREYGRPSVA
jgi:hypothetical protein